MTSVLITGILGQDGGYLAERLLAQGCTVHGLVRERDRRVALLLERAPGVILHTGDLTHDAAMVAVMHESDPDEVYNFAGISSVAYSWEQPVLTADVTALGAARLLEKVWERQERTGKLIRFVQASSAEMFGNALTSPQDETTTIAPNNPYGASKAFAHQLVAVYRGRGLHASSAILYNHESPRRPPTFVSRKIARGAVRIAQGLETHLVLGNLDARRDWGWAPDYVDAMILAARHPDPQDYVIATGQAHSVRDFVEAAFLAAGLVDWEERLRVDTALLRPADTKLMVGDPHRARQLLGWAPTVTFHELVGRMVDAELQAE